MAVVHQGLEFECAGIYKYDKFLWSIANFEQLNGSIESPIFYSGTNNGKPWKIILRAPEGGSTHRFFWLEDETRQDKKPVAWLKILHDEPMEYVAEREGVVDPHTYLYRYQFKIDHSKLTPRAQSNGTLEVLLKIRESTISSDDNLKLCSALGLADPPLCSLADRLFPFVLDEKFSDIILEIDGVDLKAHKLMLAAQSPVFCTMFEQTMKEATENRVKIDDMDVETGKQMLEFVYTNKKPSKIDEFPSELLAVAHKYEMKKLLLMCETVLRQKLTLNNAVDTLIAADFFGTEEFMVFIYDFLYKNPAVLKTPKFLELRYKNADLSMNTYDNILTKVLKL